MLLGRYSVSGCSLPSTFQARDVIGVLAAPAGHNYAGRTVAVLFTLGKYQWQYLFMDYQTRVSTPPYTQPGRRNACAASRRPALRHPTRGPHTATSACCPVSYPALYHRVGSPAHTAHRPRIIARDRRPRTARRKEREVTLQGSIRAARSPSVRHIVGVCAQVTKRATTCVYMSTHLPVHNYFIYTSVHDRR